MIDMFKPPMASSKIYCNFQAASAHSQEMMFTSFGRNIETHRQHNNFLQHNKK